MSIREEVAAEVKKDMDLNRVNHSYESGALETLGAQVDYLEGIVASLLGYIAERDKLTSEEIRDAEGLLDY